MSIGAQVEIQSLAIREAYARGFNDALEQIVQTIGPLAETVSAERTVVHARSLHISPNWQEVMVDITPFGAVPELGRYEASAGASWHGLPVGPAEGDNLKRVHREFMAITDTALKGWPS